MLKFSLSIMFAGYMALSLYLIKLGGEIPLRTIYSSCLILFVYTFVSRKSVINFFRKNDFISISLVFAFAGSAATLAGVGELKDVLIYLTKWILQPIIIMCLAYQIAFCLGPLKTFKIILLMYSVTLIIGVLQGFQVSAAWEIRSLVNSFQGLGSDLGALDDLNFDTSDGRFSDGVRARGISWSAIHLSYQSCLVIGMLFLTYVDDRYRPIRLSKYLTISILSIAFIAMVFSGTRSALIGVVCLPIVYYFVSSKNKFIYFISVIFIIVFGVYVFPLIQEALNLRVLQAQDSSANMRLPLYLFGFQLFFDQPWGYGWIDQSVYYAQEYWQEYRHMEGAESIFLRGLHNYALNILWVYGVFGLIATIYLFWYMRALFGGIFLVALVPYLVNSLFHNGGLFYGGNYIWIFIGLAKCLYDRRVEYKKKVDKFVNADNQPELVRRGQGAI